MKKLLLAAVLAVTLPGCATIRKVQPILSDAAATIGDAAAILDAIRSVATVFFLARPAPEAQAKVERYLADSQLGLSAANRALRGLENASNEQLDLAWAEFRAAYAELTAVLYDLGIVQKGGKMSTSKWSVTLPEPLAMGKR